MKNGVDMGHGLHSCKTAVKIVDHIAKEIKSEVFAKLTEQNKKICIFYFIYLFIYLIQTLGP